VQLTECYPNPFNSTAQVHFELAEQSRITLDVYDISGRRVANLANGLFTTGKYAIKWQADGLSSGVYFLRLAGGQDIVTKTVTFLK